jgi:hypothetical protein
MLIKNVLMGAVVCAGTLLGGSAHADLLQGLGQWRGTGSVLGPDGQLQSDFHVVLTRTAAGANAVETRGEVTLGSGQVIPFRQRLTGAADGRFSLDSDQGKGAGFCRGDGLCQSYEERGDARAAATVIIVDRPDTIRVVITELDHGQVLRFIQQTLTKQ